MKIVNISATDDQTFTLQIEGDSYKFRLLDRGTAGVFLDVYRNNDALIMGVACLDRVKIIRSAYKNFPGDLMFVDQLGFDNPAFPYFGTRFLLYQLASNELNMGELMSDLLLTEDWDLTLDSYGNIATTPSVAYSMAQQVANEIKLFYGEGWYDRHQGTPHFQRVLGTNTNIASIKTILTQRALGVDHVTQCEIDMYIDNDRCLHGNIFISDAEGNRANVYY